MPDSAEPRTSTTAATPACRYGAFLSYSSGDAAFVKRLHRQIEAYRLPRRLAGDSQAIDPGSSRLRPIFRDHDDLTAAFDLSTAIREAIADSACLVVVCSPRSAASKWVGREIELFRVLHGNERIFAVLLEGRSNTAFHPALGGPDGSFEPLAVNFQTDSAGRRLAFLKLYAALAGVELDELIQRDAQRRNTRLAVGAGTIVAVALALGALGSMALLARNEAAKQCNEATGLVDYLITDLRRDVGREGNLEQLAALNQGALKYYQRQDLRRLSDDALRQRAKLLQAMGEDDEKRGDLGKARSYFLEAHRTTAALLTAKPDDPKRIFAHAQSEYWVGFINWRNGDGTAARKHLEAYARLAARLVAIDPNNDDYVMETVYAANNLGTLAMRHDGDPARAERHYRAALADLDRITRRKPTDHDVLNDRSDALAWLADSQRLQGHLSEALATREVQGRILAGLIARDPRNVIDRADMLSHDLAVARIELAQGLYARAEARLESGRTAAIALAAHDPDNKSLSRQVRMFELFKVRTWLSMPPSARPPLRVMEQTVGDCTPAEPGAMAQEVGDFCGVLLAKVRAERGDQAGAAAALAPVTAHLAEKHDVLTGSWGLSLAQEVRSLGLVQRDGAGR